jgi:PspA associated protein B
MGFFNKIKRILKIDNNDNNTNNTISNPFIDSQAIESLSLACIKLDENLGLKSTGRCGICVKSINSESFKQMKEYIDNLLKVVIDKKNINFDVTFNSIIDNYGYLWFIIKGKTIEEIVAVINAIGDSIHEKGFSRQLLANIFEFSSGYSGNNNGHIQNNQYLIYNYKIDKFYPFVPIISASTNNRKRNHDQEIKIMKEVSDTIKIEEKLSLWYPIWNIPF